jgi:hypothetical protein
MKTTSSLRLIVAFSIGCIVGGIGTTTILHTVRSKDRKDRAWSQAWMRSSTPIDHARERGIDNNDE